MTVGFFGGSYDPVHNGHIALARAIAESGAVDEVWLSLSPLNPFKTAKAGELVADADRLAMLRLAADGVPGLRVTDVELSLPRPSYTVDTLAELQRLNPDCRFRLIIGSDNVEGLSRWKDSDRLLELYPPIIYPRPGYPAEGALEGLPVSDISSTEIRRRLAAGEPVTDMIPHAVEEYIRAHHLYGV